MDFFKKKKDEEEKMSPAEQSAKLNVLGGMKDGAEQDMLSKLKGMGSAPELAAPAVGLKVEVETPDPILDAAEQMSSEELQALIDKLIEKKGVMDGQSFKPETEMFK